MKAIGDFLLLNKSTECLSFAFMLSLSSVMDYTHFRCTYIEEVPTIRIIDISIDIWNQLLVMYVMLIIESNSPPLLTKLITLHLNVKENAVEAVPYVYVYSPPQEFQEFNREVVVRVLCEFCLEGVTSQQCEFHLMVWLYCSACRAGVKSHHKANFVLSSFSLLFS